MPADPPSSDHHDHPADVSDMRMDSWVERVLPGPVRAYAYLARLDRPIGTWLLLLPSLWAITLAAGGVRAMNAPDWGLVIFFALGAVIMRAAGCVINDLWDRDLDGRVARTRTRPLAAGTVTPRQALVFLALLLGAGLSILLQLSLVAILLGFLAMLFIIVYPLMKRITWWPQAFLGLTFNFGALMGWAAVTGALDIPALLLYAGGFFWTLSYDTIYAHQDKEDDIKIGIKSAALKLGPQTRPWLAVFMAASLALIFTAGLAAGKGPLFAALLLLPAAHMIWQWASLDINDPQGCLRRFKSNRDFGLLVLLAIAL